MAGSSQPQFFFAAGCVSAVHIICALQHSDIKFESKNQFCKYVKNCPEIS